MRDEPPDTSTVHAGLAARRRAPWAEHPTTQSARASIELRHRLRARADLAFHGSADLELGTLGASRTVRPKIWPTLRSSETLGDMEHRCEVCESFRPQGDLKAAQTLLEVRFGERTVRLCRGHAGIAKNSGVSSLEELRALYAESEGQRSYIARRARIAQSNADRARHAGRRASDSPR